MNFLPIAEFEANSDLNSSTEVSPFLATKGYHPRSGFEPPTPWEGKDLTSTARTELRAADKLIDKIKFMKIYLQQQLRWAQALQAEQANRKRQPAPAFKVGDMVMLDTRNIKTRRPSDSLDHKNLGPFKIVRAINNSAYELDLPSSMKIFPVFHPWLLHLDGSDPLPGQVNPPPPPVATDDGEDAWKAIEIVDSTIDKRRKDPITGKKGCLMYKIKYKGYDDWNSKPGWQIWTDAVGCTDLVTDYHYKQGPTKPGPHSSFRTPDD